MDYDVIIIGGGAAGVTAALQTARAGAHTLLVEKTGVLGGTITLAGINYPGLFHAWGQQVIRGIGWELVTASLKETGDPLPDFSDSSQPHWKHQIRINTFVFAALCDEALVQAGADLMLHTMLARLNPGDDGNSWHVTLCDKRGLSTRTCRVVIDCTGDANATALAGYKVNVPAIIQPATLSCHASGYSMDELDMSAINRAFKSEVQAGRLAYTDATWNTDHPNIARWLQSHGNNANHIPNINAHDSHGKTQVELAARRSVLRLYRFLRKQPGLQNLTIETFSPECGIRETATIQGETTVTVDDYRSGLVPADAVCYSFYPIDLHTADGKGLLYEILPDGNVPGIPRRALLPEGSRRFLVAGRCVASDRLANSALRVQASCMATGQAAGALAAISADTDTDPRDVPMATLAECLHAHQAIVPPSPCLES